MDVKCHISLSISENKKRHLTSLFLYAVSLPDSNYTITVKYFVPGHPQNENDSVHTTIFKEKESIEKKKKKTDIPIALPHNWVALIRIIIKKETESHVL